MWRAALLCLSTAIALIEGIVILKSRNQRERKLNEYEQQISKLSVERQAERKGRIKAEKEIRNALAANSSDSNLKAFPFTPIGYIRSCFSTRNGTPRQPLLVPLARAKLQVPPGGVPQAALEGLAEYSHCWLLYVFHENTDLARLWKENPHRDFRAKIRVPRLNGARLGVLATRSPHRPAPIGLSVAKIESVQGDCLFLSGADLVDGTPILDVKPYLPFCDAISNATVPSWIDASGKDDPLYVSRVEFEGKLDTELERCWEVIGGRSQYASKAEIKALLAQVLSRDIRSVFQRGASEKTAAETGASVSNGEDASSEPYSLVLEGITFKYRIEEGKIVVVHSAEIANVLQS